MGKMIVKVTFYSLGKPYFFGIFPQIGRRSRIRAKLTYPQWPHEYMCRPRSTLCPPANWLGAHKNPTRSLLDVGLIN